MTIDELVKAGTTDPRPEARSLAYAIPHWRHMAEKGDKYAARKLAECARELRGMIKEGPRTSH